MKRVLIGASVIFVSVGANAQSTLTLYGIVDEGLSYFSNVATTPVEGHSTVRLLSGVMQQSRFGLRGTEDLGSGYKTLFVLENGFDASTGKLGQGGLLFGKRSFLGVISPYGAVTLGRQYDTNVDMAGQFEAASQWGGYIVAHPGDVDNLNNTITTNQSIKFTTASFAGLKVAALIGLGGVAGDTARNRIWSASAGFTNGGFSAGAGYLRINNPNVSFFGNGGSPAAAISGVPGNNMASPVYSGFSSARTQSVAVAGASYTIGAAVIAAVYSNTIFGELGDLTSGQNARNLRGQAVFNSAEVNANYRVTPALLVGAAYDYTRGASTGGRTGATYNQFSAGIDYNVSSRTDLYTVGVFQHATGTDSTGNAAVAAINGPSASANGKQAIIRIGIRHKF
ncbi:porin [Paraburkholderia sp. J67]|uniref:porin n=1 Tax=Paraburkholderia sp. J67 TaxID=2805435 RepID=UPI002ABE550F|nr:porin [Paraburkholderia sp. J67]